MELLLRVDAGAGRVVDVVAFVDPTHTVAELTHALCLHVGSAEHGA